MKLNVKSPNRGFVIGRKVERDRPSGESERGFGFGIIRGEPILDRVKKRRKQTQLAEKTQLVEHAITLLEQAGKLERCELCKGWLQESRDIVAKTLNQIRYSQEIVKLKEARGIDTPWRKLDIDTKDELRKEARK